jgi:hypothetical protein
LPNVVRGNIDRNRRKVCYVAEYSNRYLACAIWTDPVAANRFSDGHLMLELRRMAISPEAPKNTASNMIAWMIRDIKKKFPELARVISYQDTVAHHGTIYKASGWTPCNVASTMVDWNVNGRVRAETQSKAPKIRWEKQLY